MTFQNKDVLPNIKPGFLPSIKVRQLVRAKNMKKSLQKHLYQQKLLFVKQDINVPDLIENYYKGLQQKSNDSSFQSFAVSINFKQTTKIQLQNKIAQAKQKIRLKTQKKSNRVNSQQFHKFSKIQHKNSLPIQQLTLSNNMIRHRLKFFPSSYQVKRNQQTLHNFSEFIAQNNKQARKNQINNTLDTFQTSQNLRPNSKVNKKYRKFNFDKKNSIELQRFCTLDVISKSRSRTQAAQQLNYHKKQDKMITPWVYEQKNFFQNAQQSIQLLQRSVQL